MVSTLTQPVSRVQPHIHRLHLLLNEFQPSPSP